MFESRLMSWKPGAHQTYVCLMKVDAKLGYHPFTILFFDHTTPKKKKQNKNKITLEVVLFYKTKIFFIKFSQDQFSLVSRKGIISLTVPFYLCR